MSFVGLIDSLNSFFADLELANDFGCDYFSLGLCWIAISAKD
nr:MAG TPA: hypothetical protein [Caudoviricetes sp.]